MYAGTHPQAKIARAARIERARFREEQHQRHLNEQRRRNAERIARVADAMPLTDQIALQRLCASETSNPDEAALFLLYATHRAGE